MRQIGSATFGAISHNRSGFLGNGPRIVPNEGGKSS